MALLKGKHLCVRDDAVSGGWDAKWEDNSGDGAHGSGKAGGSIRQEAKKRGKCVIRGMSTRFTFPGCELDGFGRVLSGSESLASHHFLQPIRVVGDDAIHADPDHTS